MSITNGEIVKVPFECTLLDGTIAQNVYYLEAELLAPLADATALLLIEAWVETAYNTVTTQTLNSIVQNLCTVQVVEFNVIDSIWEVVKLIGYFDPTISRINATDGLPNQSSAFATFLTDRPRSFGRKFLQPFGEDQQAGTYLISAALTAMSNYADAVLTDIIVAALESLVPGIPRAGVNLFLQFTRAVVTNVLGSQRRRRPGVGA